MKTAISEVGKYIDRGWRVFPLHNPTPDGCSCGNPECGKSIGKHPRTNHGVKDATTDPDVINHWCDKWPLANIGIATGPESDVFMIGPDGAEGLADLKVLEAELGPLPRTAHAQSGSGGRTLLPPVSEGRGKADPEQAEPPRTEDRHPRGGRVRRGPAVDERSRAV